MSHDSSVVTVHTQFVTARMSHDSFVVTSAVRTQFVAARMSHDSFVIPGSIFDGRLLGPECCSFVFADELSALCLQAL